MAKPFKSVSGYWHDFAARMRKLTSPMPAGIWGKPDSQYRDWLAAKIGSNKVEDRIAWQRKRMETPLLDEQQHNWEPTWWEAAGYAEHVLS